MLLSLWSQLAGVAHMALVAHVECPDHAGEMVHGDGDHAHGPSAAGVEAAARKRAHDAGLQQGSAPGDGHGHEHCGVAAHRGDQLAHAPGLTGAAFEIAPPTVLHVVAVGAAPAAPELASAVLAVAPKTSPPRA